MEVKHFVVNNKSAVVLLFGFEDLLKRYSAKHLKEFYIELSDSLASNKAHLIVACDESSLDPATFESFIHMVSEDNQIHSVFNILASPVRRDLLLYFDSKGKSILTKIRQALGVENAPNLSFHLRNLKKVGLVEEDSEKRYFLTDMGKEVCELLKKFEITRAKKFEKMMWTSP